MLSGAKHWRHRLTVPQFTVLTGVLVIAAGTVLMASPLCSSDDVGLWQALFTVTSAITVTGLSIIDRPGGNGECVFLEGLNVCRIQPVKPVQCRGFPNEWRFPGWRDVCEAIEAS